MNFETAGQLTATDLTDSEGSLLGKPTQALAAGEASVLRAAAKLLRARRFRLLVRCDACFEGGRADGMRGEITPRAIDLECRCRFLKYEGATL